MVGSAPVPGRLYVGQCTSATASGRFSLLRLANSYRIRCGPRFGYALDLREVPACSWRLTISAWTIWSAGRRARPQRPTWSAAGRVRSRQTFSGNVEDVGLQVPKP